MAALLHTRSPETQATALVSAWNAPQAGGSPLSPSQAHARAARPTGLCAAQPHRRSDPIGMTHVSLDRPPVSSLCPRPPPAAGAPRSPRCVSPRLRLASVPPRCACARHGVVNGAPKNSTRCDACIRAKKGKCGTEHAVAECLRRPAAGCARRMIGCDWRRSAAPLSRPAWRAEPSLRSAESDLFVCADP